MGTPFPGVATRGVLGVVVRGVRPVIRMISACLRVKPDERYASAGVMLRDVQQVRRRLASEPWKQALLSDPAMAAVGLGLLVVLLFIYALRPAPEVKPGIGKDHPESPVAATGPPGGVAAPAPALPEAIPAQTAGEPRRPRVNPAIGPIPAPPTPAPPAPEPGAGASPEVGAADQRTVRVATYDGPAEVTTREGQVLGATPYPLIGSLGKNYELWLRRPGFQPRKVDVQINVNKNEYLFGLEKNEGRSDFSKKE